MSGDLSVLDPRAPSSPARILYGPQKSITAGTAVSPGTFIAGTADGRVHAFDTANGSTTPLGGAAHTNLVSGLAAGAGKIASVGYDDQVREIAGGAFTGGAAALGAQPRGVALGGDSTAFVAGAGAVEAFRDSQRVAALQPAYTTSAVAAAGSVVAVGGEVSVLTLRDY